MRLLKLISIEVQTELQESWWHLFILKELLENQEGAPFHSAGQAINR